MELPQFYEWGVLENIQVNNGLIMVEGWAKNLPDVNIYGSSMNCYRTFRPDVVAELNIQNYFCGFVFECSFKEKTQLYINNQYILDISGNTNQPDYSSLLDMASVQRLFHKEHQP